MKILFISNLFPDQSRPIWGLDNAVILKHLSHEHEVRVIATRFDPLVARSKTHLAPRDSDRPLSPEFLSIPYLPKIGNRINPHLYLWRLRKAVLRIRNDFPFERILCAWLHPDGWAVGQVAQQLNTPFALIAQGSDVHQYLNDAYRKKLIVETVNRSLGVITRSGDLSQRLCEAGVREGIAHTVYNGIDRKLFFPGNQAEARSRLSLNADASIFLFVGNLLPIKRPQMIMDAFARFRRQTPERQAHLILLGEGPLRRELTQPAQALSLEAHIQMPGQRSPQQIADYMRAADCLTLASINEGVPNVLLEALASGLPVIAPAVGGIPEIIKHSYLGQTPNSFDAQTLAQAWARQMATPPDPTRIAAYAKPFTWDKAAAAYAAILEAKP